MRVGGADVSIGVRSVASAVKRLSILRASALLFVLIFAVLLAASAVNFYAVHEAVFRFRQSQLFVLVFSASLAVLFLAAVPAVENIAERAEKLGAKIDAELLRSCTDGCFAVFILAALEMTLIVVDKLVEAPFITFTAFTLLLTLIVVFLVALFTLWKILKTLGEAVKS